MSKSEKRDIKKIMHSVGEGALSAAAAAAINIGMPTITDPVLVGVPGALYERAASGQLLHPSDHGLPIELLRKAGKVQIKNMLPTNGLAGVLMALFDPARNAGFSGRELRIIKSFAVDQGVGHLPITAGPAAGYQGKPSKFTHLITKLIGQDISGIDEEIFLDRTSLPVAMHEIGHASRMSKNKTIQSILSDVSLHSGHQSVPGGLARFAIGSSVLAPPDKDSSKARKFMYDHAPELVGATLLPQLLEEARASGKAIIGARRYGVGALSALKELAPAFGTYLGAGAGTVLATMLAKSVVRSIHENRMRKKENSVRNGTHADSRPVDDRPVDEKVASYRQRADRPETIRAPRALRLASSGYDASVGAPPKSKSTQPSAPGARAVSMSSPRIPSNTKYHRNIIDALYNPSTGMRETRLGG